jgi:predicted exporter
VVENYITAFDKAQLSSPALLHNWLDSPLAQPYRHLWLGAYGEQIISAVGLRGVSSGAALKRLADSGQGVTYIDNVGELSAEFGNIRRQAGWLILASYILVSALMLFRYGLRGGVAVMTAPIVAATTSLGVQGLIGEPLNLFNVLAILLVLGIGVDYGIFFRETGAGNPSTLVAITLSSITTLLAFGLLALSSTTAVHAFGLTILVGIGVALLLSPLAGAGKSTGEARA